MTFKNRLLSKWLAILLMLSALVGVSGSGAAGALAPAASMYWETDGLCEPARTALQDGNVTEEGDTNWTAQRYEYDPLKYHSCGEMRDDIQEALYNETDEILETPTHWGCDSTYTPWANCVGIQIEGCDIWVSWLGWTCIGGVFPQDQT